MNKRLDPKTGTRYALGFLFILAGLNHFRRPKLYRAIMPDYLPCHAQLVALSGWAELLLGGAVLLPRWAAVAGRGLILLLAAVFPANLHMVQHAERYRPLPVWALWARLPLQPLLMAAVYWCTNDPRIHAHGRE